MKFRYARHTNNLENLIHFYTNVIGLSVLSRFENHSNYNGVFLGIIGKDWHIEFTESNEKVQHQPDKDDLLVFYFESQEKINAILKISKKYNVKISKSKNSYWQNNGVELMDPDGFGVVLALE